MRKFGTDAASHAAGSTSGAEIMCDFWFGTEGIRLRIIVLVYSTKNTAHGAAHLAGGMQRGCDCRKLKI
jgi:hypothetical protein